MLKGTFACNKEKRLFFYILYGKNTSTSRKMFCKLTVFTQWYMNRYYLPTVNLPTVKQFLKKKIFKGYQLFRIVDNQNVRVCCGLDDGIT